VSPRLTDAAHAPTPTMAGPCPAPHLRPAELEEKRRALPNPRQATVQLRAFTRAACPDLRRGPDPVRWHSLADPYA